MAIDFRQMDQFQLDVLKEVSNVGAGHAATALAKLLKRRVDMEVPIVSVLEFSEVSSVLGNEEEVMAAVITEISGSISAILLLVLALDDALSMVEVLSGKKYASLDDLDELAQSAISETGNILGGAYVGTLATMSGLNLRLSNPSVTIDMAGSILSLPAIGFGDCSENVLYINSAFSQGNGAGQVRANFFLVPDAPSYEVLYKALGVIK